MTVVAMVFAMIQKPVNVRITGMKNQIVQVNILNWTDLMKIITRSKSLGFFQSLIPY